MKQNIFKSIFVSSADSGKEDGGGGGGGYWKELSQTLQAIQQKDKKETEKEDEELKNVANLKQISKLIAEKIQLMEKGKREREESDLAQI